MSDQNELQAIAKYLAGCGNLEDADFIRGIATKLAAAEADAARYRWLRHQYWSDDTLCVVAHPKRAVRLGESCPYGSMLDAAIDAATQKEES